MHHVLCSFAPALKFVYTIHQHLNHELNVFTAFQHLEIGDTLHSPNKT